MGGGGGADWRYCKLMQLVWPDTVTFWAIGGEERERKGGKGVTDENFEGRGLL